MQASSHQARQLLLLLGLVAALQAEAKAEDAQQAAASALPSFTRRVDCRLVLVGHYNVCVSPELHRGTHDICCHAACCLHKLIMSLHAAG